MDLILYIIVAVDCLTVSKLTSVSPQTETRRSGGTKTKFCPLGRGGNFAGNDQI